MAADRLEGAKLSAQKVKKELKLANRAGNSVFLARSRGFTVFLAPIARKSRNLLHRDKSSLIADLPTSIIRLTDLRALGA